MASAALVLVPLFVLSLVLVNAQAVTALTTERDVQGARPAAGHRSDGQGIRVRQAGRRVLQHQGNGAAADGAVRLSVVRRRGERREPAVSAGRAGW